jgi:hypothetical protein
MTASEQQWVSGQLSHAAAVGVRGGAKARGWQEAVVCGVRWCRLRSWTALASNGLKRALVDLAA